MMPAGRMIVMRADHGSPQPHQVVERAVPGSTAAVPSGRISNVNSFVEVLMKKHRAPAAAFLLIALAAPATAADKIPRTASGRPDLSGYYDAATLTPMQRPEEFGDNLELTKEQAEKIVKEKRSAARLATRIAAPSTRRRPRAARRRSAWATSSSSRAARAASAATTRSGSTPGPGSTRSTASTWRRSSAIRPTVACRR